MSYQISSWEILWRGLTETLQRPALADILPETLNPAACAAQCPHVIFKVHPHIAISSPRDDSTARIRCA